MLFPNESINLDTYTQLWDILFNSFVYPNRLVLSAWLLHEDVEASAKPLSTQHLVLAYYTSKAEISNRGKIKIELVLLPFSMKQTIRLFKSRVRGFRQFSEDVEDGIPR